MPLYDYICPECQIRVSDILVTAHDEPQYCQKCGARLKKLPASPNIRFVGDGFYKTDYGKSDNDYHKEED